MGAGESISNRPGSGNFERDVHDVARLIPRGRVTSYGAIARYLGAVRSSRMVGWAMNRSLNIEPDVLPVPAHRVVNRHGILTGRLHFPTPTAMEECLQAEGIDVRNNQVVDFARFPDGPRLEQFQLGFVIECKGRVRSFTAAGRKRARPRHARPATPLACHRIHLPTAGCGAADPW